MTARRGLVIAAPQSGSGKTIVTLGLLRALKRKGVAISSAKSGPDYIDPKFHEAATGHACINLDAWAMSPEAITSRALEHTPAGSTLVIEGAMGLFDGSAGGQGSTADLAAHLNLPVILVVDASRQAQSIAALVLGFNTLRSDIRLGGIILNKVGSARHERILRQALRASGVPVLGSLSNDKSLSLPSRHLGLVQAEENPDLHAFIEAAADKIDREVDVSSLLTSTNALQGQQTRHRMLTPIGNRIAIAKDTAFSFIYPHILRDWTKQGCDLTYFSPLADQGPDAACDAIYLPGGYPELWAGELAAAARFQGAMREAAKRNVRIYGECGGFMVLGQRLIDADGKGHSMLGLLPLETSFHRRERHLGYRKLKPIGALPWQEPMSAHEFHYSTVASETVTGRVFEAADAEGNALGPIGLGVENVFGSYAHMIDVAPETRKPGPPD